MTLGGRAGPPLAPRTTDAAELKALPRRGGRMSHRSDPDGYYRALSRAVVARTRVAQSLLSSVPLESPGADGGSMNSLRTIPVLLAASLAAACGGNQGTQPDDMSAEDHRRAAAGEQAESDAHGSRYDPDTRATTGSSSAPNSDLFYGPEVYNPTEVHRHASEEHRTLAEQHRAAAAALEAYEEQECGRFPAATRAACPLLGQVAEVEDVDGGVRIELAEEAMRDAVADHMRCHVAYARTQGREGMDQCPLYAEGASVTSDADGVILTTDAGEEAVGELRRRARAHAAH